MAPPECVIIYSSSANGTSATHYANTHILEKVSPIYLLLPLTSSLFVIFGLLYLQRAQSAGISSWTTLIGVNWACALVYPPLLLLGGDVHLDLIYQPAVIGGLFLLGQFCVLLSIRWGDVSISAPVQGIKVLLVPALAALFQIDEIRRNIWWAAALALTGIVLVQAKKGHGSRAQITAGIVFALLAALCMSVFDLLLMQWAPLWGKGNGTFLAISFAFAGLFATPFLPWADSPQTIKKLQMTRTMLTGCFLMAVQSIGMTWTLAYFGDPTRVNIVYSLRGLWGVLLTWLLARQFGATAPLDGRVMKLRLAGAVLLTIAVIVAVM